MRQVGLQLLLIVLFVSGSSAQAQEPKLLSGPGVSPAVWGVLETPRLPDPHPGVVVLHGASGWRPSYALYAKALADSGFVALAINYFAETGRDTAWGQSARMWLDWQAAIGSAAEYLRSLPSVSKDHLGLVGFSRGAFLAVSVASSIPAVRAVVDYFGGINTSTNSLKNQVRNFPPLLILHGDADTVVPVRFAYFLSEAVVANGGEVEMHIYPGVHHGFNAAFGPTYNDSAASNSFRRTIEFLRKRLSD
jgi:carboxymethylenebutenolidase